MFIAQELRKKNIAEYLLYMWQVEDTIRAFGCSLPRIRREYIERFDYDDEQKEDYVSQSTARETYLLIKQHLKEKKKAYDETTKLISDILNKSENK